MLKKMVIPGLTVAMMAMFGCNGQAGEDASPAKPDGNPAIVLAQVGQFSTAISNQIKYPTRMAAAADGTLFVSDVAGNRVYGVLGGTRVIELIDMDQPLGVAVHDNLLYVGNKGRSSVEVYDLTARKFVRALNAKIEMPNGIAVAADGTVYVADSTANNVKVFEADGSLRGTLDGLKFPVAVAVDAQRVVVADQGNHRVVIFDHAGKQLNAFGQAVSEKATKVDDFKGRFTRLQDVALQGQNILALDAFHGHVQVLGPDGTSKAFIGRVGDCETCVHLALGIAVDRDGQLLATDPENKRWLALSSEVTP